MDELVTAGAIPTKSPRKVTERSDVIITIFSNSSDVEEVVLEPSGRDT